MAVIVAKLFLRAVPGVVEGYILGPCVAEDTPPPRMTITDTAEMFEIDSYRDGQVSVACIKL